MKENEAVQASFLMITLLSGAFFTYISEPGAGFRFQAGA